MTGYTRQSTSQIINGANITAPPLNAEFNQLVTAFGPGGHSHDGSTGNAPKIELSTSVDGYLPAVHGGTGGKNNPSATSNPTNGDDANDGYARGSFWYNYYDDRWYICYNNAVGSAVWRELLTVETGSVLEPHITNTVDLGSNLIRFKDLYLSGDVDVAGNTALTGTLNITGATALSSTLGVTGDTTLVNLSATGTSTLTSVDVNSGAVDNTVIGNTTPAAGTFTTLNANTSLTAATADINGGTIDGATIGASTPSTGDFTTVSTTGQATLASADINGGSIDGTVIGATSHTTGKFTTVQSTGQATLASADINGGAIDGTTIGTTTPSSGAFTTVSASGGVAGDLTGDVTGNVTGNITGNVTGDVTGNVTGNITSTGSSSFNNVTIDGTLNMNAGTTATITNLTDPTNPQDAATKAYVDAEIADVIDSAPGTLDTLNELAAALGDDANFSTTVTNSIATKLPLAGGAMSGAIAMGGNKVTGVTDPTAAQDAATKAYVDQQDGLQVTKSGDTMSGNLAMGSNKVTGLAAPTSGGDATNKTYVDGILGSATAAATSAANAATSEANAATSETNASNSASAAATSEANAAASYDDFDDRYLGPKAVAPALDNDGDALIVGALYFNTASDIMYVYGSGGWVPAGSSVNGTSDRVTYTASAGQTVFAATYDTGYVDVYLNGVKLLAGTDFTATNGTSIALASGATLNDVVDIVAYGTFTLADNYTKTQSDARYVEVAGDTMTGDLTVPIVTITNEIELEGATGSNALIQKNASTGRDELQIYAGGDAYSTGSRGAGIHLYGNSDSEHDGNFAVLTGPDDNGDARIIAAGREDKTHVTIGNGIWDYVDDGDDHALLNLKGASAQPSLLIEGASSTEGDIVTVTGEAMQFGHWDKASTTFTERMRLSSNGDINFFEDTGTTPKFYWSASTERLGLGTITPSTPLHVFAGSNNTDVAIFTGAQLSRGLKISTFSSSGSNDGGANLNVFNALTASINGTEAFRLDSGGVDITGANTTLKISNTAETDASLILVDSADPNQNMTMAYNCQIEEGRIDVDGKTHVAFRQDGNTYFGEGGGGTSAPYYDAGNATQIFPQIALNSTAAGTKNNGTMGLFTWGTGGNVETQLVLGHSTSGVIGDNSTALVEGNNLGRMLWNGSDGTKMANGAFMFAEAAGTWTSSTAPTNLTIGIEKDDGSYASTMLSHDGYWGMSDLSRWSTTGTIPNSLLHLYGNSPILTIDNATETEGGILFRDGNAGTPDSQSAAIMFDSGSTVSTNALSFYSNDYQDGESALAMRIHHDGEVSRPKQPAFHAETSITESPMVNGDITFGVELLDNNGDYTTSNGRFTAPVDGLYTFTAVLTFVDGDNVDDSMAMVFKVNGAGYASFLNDPNVHSGTGIESSNSFSCVVSLSAGDYVTVALSGVSSTRPCALKDPSHFMGHLI